MKPLLLFFLTAVTTLWVLPTHAQVTTIEPDTLGKKHILDLVIEGNKLTKDHILLREMTINRGDTLYWGNLNAGMEQSKNNIMNLGLFNFVEIKPIPISKDDVIVLISVLERWYVYPLPILEIAQTNFNTWWEEEKKLKWLNYGVYVSHHNFRGRNEKISITARFGYTKKFSAAYSIPNLNQKQTLSLNMAAGYFENDEITYNTVNNKREFYSDPVNKARKHYQYQIGLGYRENIFLKHHFQIAYISAHVSDSVPHIQPEYFMRGDKSMRYLRATYAIDYDTRDYKRYPLQGMRVFGVFEQSGLGIVNRDGLSLFTSVLGYTHHFKFAERIYFAYSLSGKVNWSEPPYYLTRGLGYADLVRGYEFYILDGTRWGMTKTNLKYEIIKPKSITLPLIPSEKFNKTFIALYGNLFFDSGYVYGKNYEASNSLVNKYIYSFGVGLDFVTYYDKVMRVEGTLNGKNEFGVYIAFTQSF